MHAGKLLQPIIFCFLLRSLAIHRRDPSGRREPSLRGGWSLWLGGRLLRIYEKGKQLGDPLSPWVRWELELHNKDRTIPLDVLIRPGHYLAGGYPCLSWICESQDRIKTTRKQLMISF